jgi:hypothetical protein
MSHDYLAEARDVANKLGIDFSKERFNEHDLARGIKIEYEHGRALSAANCGYPDTNVTNDDLLVTAKIALAHLYERRDDLPGGQCGDRSGRDTQYDYYDGLELVETAPVGYWRGTDPKTYWLNKKIGIVVMSTLLISLLFLSMDAMQLIKLPRALVGFLSIWSIIGTVFVIKTWK